MEKKTFKLSSPRAMLYLDIKNNYKSFQLIIRNGWAIKFSVYRGENILLVFTSTFTCQTVVRYFTNEDDAVDFINYITAQNPQEEIEA
jgi:hypothetical protein